MMFRINRTLEKLSTKLSVKNGYYSDQNRKENHCEKRQQNKMIIHREKKRKDSNFGFNNNKFNHNNHFLKFFGCAAFVVGVGALAYANNNDDENNIRKDFQQKLKFLSELQKSGSYELRKIRCYLDFDGTLTKLSGLATIESEFYRFLFVDPNQVTSSNYDKNEAEGGVSFKNEEARWEIIEKEFKEGSHSSHSNLLITEPAKRLLKAMLEMDADIIIVSKNRKEYIKDMLKCSGFSKEDIAKFTIYDVRDGGGNKFDRVTEHEMNLNHPASQIIIADDSKGDYDQILFAIKNLEDENGRVYPDEKIIARNCVVGEFDGDDVLEQALSFGIQNPIKQHRGMGL